MRMEAGESASGYEELFHWLTRKGRTFPKRLSGDWFAKRYGYPLPYCHSLE
jgi:hypothetical protein